MSDIAEFLITHYYSKYKGERKDIVPTLEQIEQGIANHPDKFVIVADEKIRGVALFLTLSDETYKTLETFDITQVDVLKILLTEFGSNVHFVLLCADGVKTIVRGIKEVKRRVNPKTISWWNPDLSILHKYEIKGV